MPVLRASVESSAGACSFDDFDCLAGGHLAIDFFPLFQKSGEGKIVVGFGAGHVGEAPFEGGIFVEFKNSL